MLEPNPLKTWSLRENREMGFCHKRKYLSLSSAALSAAIFLLQSLSSAAFANSTLEKQIDSAQGTEQTVNFENKNLPQVTKCIEIDAPVDRVWAAIKERRVKDQNQRQLLNYNGKVAVIQEKFPSIPVIGNTTCTYAENEIRPLRFLEYKLLSSNHLHAFEGYWRLNAGPRPNTTMVSLTSTIDPGIRCPFWKQIAKAVITKNVNDTLNEVEVLSTAQAVEKQ